MMLGCVLLVKSTEFKGHFFHVLKTFIDCSKEHKQFMTLFKLVALSTQVSFTCVEYVYLNILN